MSLRPKHPNKLIEEIIRYAESRRWRYKKAGNSAHAWGRLYCPLATQEGCCLSVWSTPKNVVNHARQIKKKINQCQHIGEE